MDKKQLVEVLGKIASVHRAQFDERRKYEWKVLLSTLGVYAASVVAKLTGRVSLPSTPVFIALVWVSFAGLAVISSIYLSYIHRANDANKKFAQVAEDALMDLSGVEEFAQIRAQFRGGAR